METDYIPDVELGADMSAPANNGKPESIKDLADAWKRQLPNPMTFEDMQNETKKVSQFGWKMIDFMCSGGTCPAPAALAPELVAEIKKVETLNEGFEAMVSRGFGNIGWAKTDSRYGRVVDICMEMFRQADLLMNKANANQAGWSKLDPRKLFNNPVSGDGFSFWKGAIAVTLGIVAVATFSDLVKSVKGHE